MIHDAIMNRVRDYLEHALISAVPVDDPARAGVIKLGDLNGEPDPDVARISITIHENDPDSFVPGAVTGIEGDWSDEILEVEIGGAVTWVRRFTIKARCLLESTKEDLVNARKAASTVRTRIEHALPRVSFDGILEDGEYVSRGIISSELVGEMIQVGGPPDSYDFLIKIRFDVWTTQCQF